MHLNYQVPIIITMSADLNSHAFDERYHNLNTPIIPLLSYSWHL